MALQDAISVEREPSYREGPVASLPRGVASADWRFLLPKLRFESILCLGIPSEETLVVLRRMTQRLVVAALDSARHRELINVGKSKTESGFDVIWLDGKVGLPFDRRAFELVWVSRSTGSPNPGHHAWILTEVARVLKPEGVLYFEFNGLVDRLLERKALRAMSKSGLKSQQVFWLAPMRGEMRTAVPLGEPAIAHHVFQNILHGQSPKGRWLSRIAHFLNQRGWLDAITPRHGVLAKGESGAERKGTPPEYLSSVAADAGVELADFRFGFSARGIYSTNKVLFHLFQGRSRQAGIIVRIVRDPRLNHSLENEYWALKLIRGQKLVDPSTTPAPIFLGYHEGTAILAEEAIHGLPVRQAGTVGEDSEVVLQIVDWITDLGSASRSLPEGEDKTADDRMRELLDACGAYPFSRGEIQFLQGQIGTVAQLESHLPWVFQHGDAALENVLLTNDGKLVFIDWECATPRGLPLWDLFVFFRSLALWINRMQGNRDFVNGFERQLLEGSRLNEVMVNAVTRYCNLLGLDRAWVEPLFYTCWLHGAAKDARRLSTAELAWGEYFNLLRRAIARRNAQGIQKLFGG